MNAVGEREALVHALVLQSEHKLNIIELLALAWCQMSADGRFGIEFDSFVWRGWGMYTQLWGVHLTFLALPHMRAAKYGRIIMISSRAAFRGELTCADYGVSKAGMVNLARSLARSEGPFGITANSVCPGWVETEMAAPDLALRGDEITAEIPLGRVAQPQDVANAALFFASSLGSYSNGTALGLNGGSFLH